MIVKPSFASKLNLIKQSYNLRYFKKEAISRLEIKPQAIPLWIHTIIYHYRPTSN